MNVDRLAVTNDLPSRSYNDRLWKKFYFKNHNFISKFLWNLDPWSCGVNWHFTFLGKIWKIIYLPYIGHLGQSKELVTPKSTLLNQRASWCHRSLREGWFAGPFIIQSGCITEENSLAWVMIKEVHPSSSPSKWQTTLPKSFLSPSVAYGFHNLEERPFWALNSLRWQVPLAPCMLGNSLLPPEGDASLPRKQKGPKLISEEQWHVCSLLVDVGFSGESKIDLDTSWPWFN